MALYTTVQLDAMASAYETAGIDLTAANKAQTQALKTAQAPSPKPQKAPPSGATPQQRKCAEVAYLLYQIDLIDPDVNADDAYHDYCKNFDGCFPV